MLMTCCSASERKKKSGISNFLFFLPCVRCRVGYDGCLVVLISAFTAAGEAFSIQLIGFSNSWPAPSETQLRYLGEEIITRDNQRGMEEQIPLNRINPAGERSEGERKGLVRGK